MPFTHQIPEIVSKIKDKIAKADIPLKIISKDIDDDWLYIVVISSKPGIPASDYADFMSQVERELRADGISNVILVPVLTDRMA